MSMLTLVGAITLHAVGDAGGSATGADVNRWLRARGLKPHAYIRLQRFEQAGLVTSNKGRRERFYALTDAGRVALERVREEALHLCAPPASP